MIIQFKVKAKKSKEGEKLAWKKIEMEVRKKYPKLKVVYARSDEKSGELALSSYKLNSETIDKLTKDVVKVENEEFTLSKLEGDALKDFWQNQGGHY